MPSQGAIEMATTELGAGSLGEVKQLAQQIITAQQREIQQMARGSGRGRRLHGARKTRRAAPGQLDPCRPAGMCAQKLARTIRVDMTVGWSAPAIRSSACKLDFNNYTE